MKLPAPASALDLEDENHPAHWGYIGWCAAKHIHYTEVWYPVNVDEFLKVWNKIPCQRK